MHSPSLIRVVWSESSLSIWRNLGPLATHWAHSEDSDQPGHHSDQTGRMPRLIWVFAGRTVTVGFVMSRLIWKNSRRESTTVLTYQVLWQEVSHPHNRDCYDQDIVRQDVAYSETGKKVYYCKKSVKITVLFCSISLSLNTLITECAFCLILIHGPRQANLVLIAYASSEGSGEPAHPRSLARTSAARSYKQWVKRNLQTENQIPGPSEWLGMRS